MRTENLFLAGTFYSGEEIPSAVIRNIVETFSSNQIFVFRVEDENKFLITFNVNSSAKFKDYKAKYKNTLQFHRNKDTKTLFTINSLNKVIELQNGGQKDSTYKVKWEEYKNSCLVLDADKNLKVLKLNLEDVVNLKN